MRSEHIFPLDVKTIEFFAKKGADKPVLNNSNGLCVRRIMQLIHDFSKKPFNQLRIIDLACGEGVYAIEAALHGAYVKALDARIERMNEGAKAAERIGLKNLDFEQNDIRNVNVQSHGKFDIVLFLGILYHLDQRDVFPVLRNIYEMCQQFVIIDTHIAIQGLVKVKNNGRIYAGKHYREHNNNDPEEIRKSRLQASLDNPLSFWFTKRSLFRLLNDVGFTSVSECNVPLDPTKPLNRITIIAYKGERVTISSYPWVNEKSKDEIEQSLVGSMQTLSQKFGTIAWFKHFGKFIVNRTLHFLGFEIGRI